jgi:hypothetical protein
MRHMISMEHAIQRYGSVERAEAWGWSKAISHCAFVLDTSCQRGAVAQAEGLSYWPTSATPMTYRRGNSAGEKLGIAGSNPAGPAGVL